MTNFTCNLNSTPHAGETRLLWLVILVLGGVFFFVFHDLSVSRFEQFAPWSDTDEIKAAGGNVVKGAALSLLGLLGVYFLWQKEGRKLQLGGPLAALMFFYVAWAALSITWSIEPWLTTRHVAVLCFCFLAHWASRDSSQSVIWPLQHSYHVRLSGHGRGRRVGARNLPALGRRVSL